jgi:phospholipase A-2-activating protein
VRALAKLPKGHKSGGEIASATNDGVIRIWTLNGKKRKELIGHESFIYCLAVLPSGDIASSGEDRTVRIWDGPDCLQVITLPAISVWSVGACPNGDIITGSSDKIARIFTKDEKRLADPAVIAQFDEQVQSSVVPEQQMGELNKIDAPGPDFLERKSGTKEGQTQTIKEADGSMWLYSWSSSQGWTKVGQVVGAAPSSGNKKMHNGKEYDYVFDVDIDESKPPLKLPYNTTQNPHEAAMKFLQDNELPMSYLDETANFIVKSTQGASLGQSSQPQPQPAGADPWGSESRYRPDAVSTYQPPASKMSSKKLPHKVYISIVTGKPEASYRQILKLNSQYIASSDSQSTLSEAEFDILSIVLKQLETHNFNGPPSIEPTSTFNDSVLIAAKVATQWQPPQNRLAGLDLLRFLAAAIKDHPNLEVKGENLVALIANSGIFERDMLVSNPKLPMVAIRFFSNLVYNSDLGRGLLEAEYDLLLSKVKLVTPMIVADTALAVAVATFYLNLAVYFTSKPMLNRAETPERGLAIVEELQKILSSFPAVDSQLTGAPLQQATEPVFRAVVGLGTVLTGLKDEQIKMAAKDVFDVPATLNQLKVKGLLKESRFQGLASEISAALS